MESHLQASKILKDFFSKGFRDVWSFAFPIFFTAIFLLALKVIICTVIIKDLVVSAAKKMTVFVNIRLDHITFISENIQCTINKTKKVDIKNAGFMRPATYFFKCNCQTPVQYIIFFKFFQTVFYNPAGSFIAAAV